MSKHNLGLRRAGTAGLAVALSLGVAGLTAESASADFAATMDGQIGIIDQNPTLAGTQGATSVVPGVNGQALDDVQLLIPNTFKNGDTIDLAVFDRTATATSSGQINADAAHKLGFSGTPNATVPATPYVPTTNIGPTEPTAGDTQNNPVADTTPGHATTPPVFTTSLVQSSRANGLATDIVRLTVNGVQSGGNPLDKFIVNVQGLKADLGTAVSPGELRVVPFAFNGTPSSTNSNASSLFDGNQTDNPLTPAVDPTIHTYTVPAYVAPVTFNVGAPNNIVADSTTQNVGPITIAETNNYSLQDGTYTVHVNGASVQNDSTTPITVTTTNAATGETVTSPATVAGDNVSFGLTGASNTSKLTVTLTGLQLATGTKGPITYEFSGGSIGDSKTYVGGTSNAPAAFNVTAGTSAAIGDAPPNGVPADADFLSPGGTKGVNQKDIDAPAVTVNSSAQALPTRIGGANRYETAAKIALFNGSNDFVVLASGQNFPDALSSDYLSEQIGGGSVLLTKQGSLPRPTADAMRITGTRTVFVVGGANAVSDAVVNQLKSTPQYYPGGQETIGQGKLQVIRLDGSTRYGTNRAVNEYAFNLDGKQSVGRTNVTFGQSSKATALLATGTSYADALSAGPATEGNGTGHLPLVLTNGSSLSAEAQSQLRSFDIKQVVIAGGTSAVSSGVESQLTGMGIAVKRVSGANRYGTATAMADFENAPSGATSTTEGGLGFDSTLAYLATGQKFADALAGGPLAAGQSNPVLLTTTDSLSPETQKYLSDNAAQYDAVTALGLGMAVSEAALNAANSAIAGG